jgi:hypothetical protein
MLDTREALGTDFGHLNRVKLDVIMTKIRDMPEWVRPLRRLPWS